MPKTIDQVLSEEQQRADAESSDPMLHMLSQVDAQSAPQPAAAPVQPMPGEDTSQPDPNGPGFFTHLGRSLEHAPEVGSQFLVRGLEGSADTVGLLPADQRRELQLDQEHLQRRTAGDVGTETGVKRAILGAPAMATEMASLAIPGAGLPLFAASAGGNTTEDALDAGASPTAARVAGGVSTLANLVAPGVAGKAITPVAAAAGRAVGDLAGKAIGTGVEGAVHGAGTGEALSLGQAGATAVYDPQAALEQVEDPTMAVIGALGGGAGAVPRARAASLEQHQAEALRSAQLWDTANKEAPTAPATPVGATSPLPGEIPQDFDNAPHVQMQDMLARHEAEANKALEGAVLHEQTVEEANRQQAAAEPQVPTGSPLEDPERARINADVDRTRWGQAKADLAGQEAAAKRSREISGDVDQGMQEQLRHQEGELRAAQATETAQSRGMKGSFRYDPATGQHEYQPAAEASPAATITPEHIAKLSDSIDQLRAALTRPTRTPEEVSHEVRPAEGQPQIHPETARPDGGQPEGGVDRVQGDGSRGAVRAVVPEGKGQEAAHAPAQAEDAGQAPDVAAAEERGRPAGDQGGAPGVEGQRRGVSSPIGEPEPPAPGHVRMYHGGHPGEGPRHFSSDRSYAEGYAKKSDAPVSYVDVPEDHPAIKPEYPDQSVAHGFTAMAELPAEIAERAKVLPKSEPTKAAPLQSKPGPTAKQPDEAPPRVTREHIRQSIERTPIARKRAGYADTMMELIDRRAHALGMHPDEYVGRRMAGVQNEPYKAKTPSLNEAETFDQRLDVPSNHLRHEYLLKQWKKAHGDRSPTPTDKDWQKLVKQAAMVDEAQGRKFTDDTLHQEGGSREETVAEAMDRARAIMAKAEAYRDGPWRRANIAKAERLANAIVNTAKDYERRQAERAKTTAKSEPVDDNAPLSPEGQMLKDYVDKYRREHPEELAQDKPLSDAHATGISPDVVKRGAISFLHDGRAIIQVLEHSDESTIPHELMHMWRRELSPEDLAIAERWANVKNGKWTRPQEERFARAGERWMRSGNAPIPELKSVFKKLHDWLKAIYETIRNSPLDVKLTPEMEALFGRLFKPGQKLPEGMGDEAMRASEGAKETPRGAKESAARPSMNQKDAFGRPDLAKSGATDAGRKVEDHVDEARKLKPAGPTPDEVKEKASHADANDTSKVILERAAAGESYRNDEERAAAKIAIRKAVDAAGADPEKVKAAARLVSAHRDIMSQWGKIGRQSWDELETPEQRWSHAREDVFDPPRGLMERMRAARKMADELFQKEGQTQKVKRLQDKLAALERENVARIAKLKRRVKGYGFDLDDPNAAWVHDPDQLQEVKRAIVAANGDAWDAAHEVYLNSRHWSANLINPLGGVKTSADAVSIMAHFGLERPLEALFNSVKGSHDSASFKEAGQVFKGLARAFTGDKESGVPSAWRSFTRSLTGDTHAFDQDFAHAMAGENELHHFGATSYGQVPGKTGKVLRFSIRMVKALDSAMKTVAAHMDVGAQAVRIARRDDIAHEDLADFIHRQITDTESEAWHNAVATARRLTFTAKPGVVVGAINKLKYMSPKNGGERALKEVMRYQFLFPGIPTQIIKRGLAMLPGVGPLMMLGKAGKGLFDMRPTGNGWSYSRAEFNQDLATSALAGGLATVLGLGVAGSKTDDGKNRVTGFNDKERPTTVNLFGKDWNYKKALGPLAHPIATAMDFFHATHAPGKEVDAHGKPISHWGTKERHGNDVAAPANLTDRYHALVASLGEQAINESMWRSTVDLAKAVGEPIGQAVKGEDMTGNKLAAFMGNFVTGFVPTVLKQAGGALNPVEEDRKLEGDFWHRLGQSALYNLDVPGLQAPPKVAYFGQPLTKDTLGGPATTFLWRLTGGEKLGDAPDTSLGSRVVTRWNELHEDHPFPAIPAKIPGASEAQRNEILARAGKATEARVSGIVGLNPNEPSFRSMRAILYLHQQEVQRATKQVLGR